MPSAYGGGGAFEVKREGFCLRGREACKYPGLLRLFLRYPEKQGEQEACKMALSTSWDRRSGGEVKLTRRLALTFVAVGIGLVCIGIVALVAAFSATIATMITMGLVLVAAGLVKAAEAFIPGRGGHGVVSGVFAAVLYVVVGALVLARPGIAAVAVSAMLGMLFVLGLARLASIAVFRFANWGWAALSGVASVVLGIIVLASWPISAVWLVGTLLGVEFIFAGIELIGFAATLPRISEFEYYRVGEQAGAKERPMGPERRPPSAPPPPS